MSFGNIMEHFISTEITQYQIALRLFQTIPAFDYFFVSRSSKIKIKTLFFSCSQSQQSLFELMIHVIGPLPQQLEPIQSGVVKLNVVYFIELVIVAFYEKCFQSRVGYLMKLVYVS